MSIEDLHFFEQGSLRFRGARDTPKYGKHRSKGEKDQSPRSSVLPLEQVVPFLCRGANPVALACNVVAGLPQHQGALLGDGLANIECSIQSRSYCCTVFFAPQGLRKRKTCKHDTAGRPFASLGSP